MVTPPPKPVFASTPILKHKTITTTTSTSQTQSTIVNIPKLLNVESVTTNTGSVNFSTSGENITINASGGTSTGTQWNDKKYSITGTHTLTSMSNNLPLTYAYNDGTYTGTIVGQGVTTSTVVTGGSYTPADTKTVTGSYTTSPGGSIPSTYYYSSGGYVGTLYQNGASVYVSGQAYATRWQTEYKILCSNGTWQPCSGYYAGSYRGWVYTDYFAYNDGTYQGALYADGNFPTIGSSSQAEYGGTVVHNNDLVYNQGYIGSATRPESDTRVYGTQYSQNYSGTVYKGGNDNLYSYTFTINYYDDVLDLNVDSSAIGVNTTNAVNIDALNNCDVTKPVGFDPTQLTGKTIELNNDYVTVTNNQVEKMQNTAASPVDANMYAVAYNGYDYEDWKPLNPDGTFSQNMYFNEPGVYHSKIKFKNYTTESEPLDKYYIADWISPTVNVQSKIPGQTAVTGSTYEVTLTANDNLSPYLFYSTDNTNWYLIHKGVNDITFNNISKSPQGKVNKLTLKVSDLCGNVEERTLTVWGIQ